MYVRRSGNIETFEDFKQVPFGLFLGPGYCSEQESGIKDMQDMLDIYPDIFEAIKETPYSELKGYALERNIVKDPSFISLLTFENLTFFFLNYQNIQDLSEELCLSYSSLIKPTVGQMSSGWIDSGFVVIADNKDEQSCELLARLYNAANNKTLAVLLQAPEIAVFGRPSLNIVDTSFINKEQNDKFVKAEKDVLTKDGFDTSL